MSGSEPFHAPLVDPPSSDDANVWGTWGVAFLDGLSSFWANWQKSWTRQDVPRYRPGDSDAFFILDRETRVVGYTQQVETGRPPPGLDHAVPALKKLSAAVQRFSAGGGWIFGSTQEAEDLAEALLKLGQDIVNERYTTISLAGIEHLSRLVTMATTRARVSDLLVEPTASTGATDVVQSVSEPITESLTGQCLPPRARKAGEQYRQVAEAMGESSPDDRAAYDQLAAAMKNSGEEFELPSFATWQRNLRTYRSITGQQKHRPRAARTNDARSIVRDNEI